MLFRGGLTGFSVSRDLTGVGVDRFVIAFGAGQDPFPTSRPWGFQARFRRTGGSWSGRVTWGHGGGGKLGPSPSSSPSLPAPSGYIFIYIFCIYIYIHTYGRRPKETYLFQKNIWTFTRNTSKRPTRASKQERKQAGNASKQRKQSTNTSQQVSKQGGKLARTQASKEARKEGRQEGRKEGGREGRCEGCVRCAPELRKCPTQGRGGIQQ